jgi:phospholipid-translocating ATPase
MPAANEHCRVIELHHKTFISFLGLFISATGWFVWNIFLAAVYPNKQSIYLVHRAFLHNFGRNLEWWTSVVLALAAVIILELVVGAVRRVYWPRDQDLMQRIERDQRVRDVLKEHSAENGEAATAAAGGAGGGNAAAGEGDASTKKGKSSVEVTYVGRGRGYDYDDDEPARPASAVSATSFHRFDWEPPAAPAPPVPPLPQPGQQPRSQPPRRARTSTDGYVPPPFTPPAEERENPFDAGSNSSGPAAGPDGGGGHGLASRWLSGRRGAGGPEPMSIELQSPPAGRRGGR